MPPQLLKRTEQVVVALLLAAAFLAIIGYWSLRAWHHRDLVEFDQAPPLEAAFLIDINRATWPELMQLPGIGETTAKSIVTSRQAGGPFRSLAEVQNRVNGIGPRMIETMTPFLLPLPNESPETKN